jgi:N-acyl-D-aspartate/D-glutamate deacylase
MADVTIFSAEQVKDVGSYADPHHYPEGILWVIVNGAPVVENGKFTAARPGTVLRRAPGRKPAR